MSKNSTKGPKKVLLLTLLLLTVLIFSGLSTTDAANTSTWVKEGNNWKYYKSSGEAAKSEWLWLENTNTGVSNWKYFNSKGESIDQFWHEDESTWLSQAGPTTSYIKGWWSQNGIDYYFRENSGSRVSGWQYIDGAWRYFRESGSMIKSRWEFLKVDDANISNWKFFNSKGESIDQFWNENENTWLSQAGPDTTYLRGWWSQNDLTYFFRENSGSRVSGWQYIDGWKYFRESGSEAFGWQYINSQWYYLDELSGNRASGVIELDGTYYLFDDDGIFVEEIEDIDSYNSRLSETRKKIVDLAYSKVGSTYIWGTAGPNTFDCSGLAYYVYKEVAGITLNRTSSSQANQGTKISKDELQAGDLLFFYNSSSGGTIGHVGIYVGDNKYVHAKGKNYGVVESTFSTANKFAWATKILD